MMEYKYKSAPVDETIITYEVLGKKVVSDKGDEIGKVKSIHIHPTKLKVEGVTVDSGLFKEKSYVGRSYIRSIGPNGVILKITPLKEVLGLDVIDVDNKKIGEVKAIERSRKTNRILSIKVGRGVTKGDLIVPKRYIREIGDSVMLNRKVDE